jgi:hypothetical protein
MSCNRKKQLSSAREMEQKAPWWEEEAESSGEKDGKKKFVYENIMCVMCFLAFLLYFLLGSRRGLCHEAQGDCY